MHVAAAARCAIAAAVLIATGCGASSPDSKHGPAPAPALAQEFDGAALLSPATGETISRLPGVSAAASDGAGGWFVERHLGKSVAGAGCIARVLPAGTIDPRWRAPLPMSGCEGTALLSAGPRLYVGGRIEIRANGRRRPLVALNARTGALLTWAPSLPRGAHVRDLATWRGMLFVLYDLGVDAQRGEIAALDAATGARLGWRPAPASLRDPDDPGAQVRAMAVRDGVVYAGVGARVLALDARDATLRWRSDPIDEGSVGILSAGRSSVYASGWHTSLTRVDRATGKLLRSQPRVPGVAGALGRDGSTVYAISGVEWGFHNWGATGTEAGMPAAVTIDDRSGRLTTWRAQLAPWTLAHAVVPGRGGVLVVGEFRPTA